MNLTVQRGEIHAICGENGAGKSTLMKVLTGVYPHGSYDGEIVFEGQTVRVPRHPRQRARRDRHHPPGAGADPRAVDRREHLPRQRERRPAGSSTGTAPTARPTSCSTRVGLTENPLTPIKHLGIGKQQLVEIAKALSTQRQAADPRRADRRPQRRRLRAPAQPAARAARPRASPAIMISHKLNEIAADRRQHHDPARRPDDRDPDGRRRRGRRGPDHPGDGRPRPRAPLPALHAADRRGALRGQGLERHAARSTTPARSSRDANLGRAPRRDRRASPG